MTRAKHFFSKLLAGLLLLTVLVSALPLFGAAAGAKAEESLYVTEGLVLSLTAFDPADPTVDLAGGTWKNTLGEETATLVGGAYSSDNPTGWQMGEKGGLFYRFSSLADFSAKAAGVGLSLPASVLCDENFTVEAVFRPDYIKDSEGNLVTHNNQTSTNKWGAYTNTRSFLSVAGLQWCFFHPSSFNGGSAETPNYSGASMQIRQFYYKDAWNKAQDKIAFSQTYPLGTYSVKNDGSIQNKILSEVMSLSISRTVSPGAEYVCTRFEGSLGGTAFSLDNGNGTGRTDGTQNLQKDFYPLADCTAPFEMFFGLPSTVYAIRAYNRALTPEERTQNAFADIVTYTGADTEAYFALPEEVRATVHEEVVKLGFGASAEDVCATILSAKELYEQKEADRLQQEKERAELLESLLSGQEKGKYDKYYVQNGLTVFLDGFISMKEWNTDISLDEGTWHSKVGNVSATLGGASYWKEAKDGRGIEYRMTKEEYRASLLGGVCPVDISLDATLLPKNFTVETVAKFVGLTNANGTRYEDPATSTDTWGIYTNAYSAFSFGTLKSMNFLCKSYAKNGTGMETRWCYTPKEWSEHYGASGANIYTSHMVQNQDPTVPTSLSVLCHHPNSESVAIKIYEGNSLAFAKNTTNIEDPEPEFHLFKGLAATVYAIRVYDRALSEAELAQNHMADLLSYYNLDTSLLDLVLACTDIAAIAESFNDLGFDMTGAEAAAAFRSRLVGTWLSFSGFSVKLGSNPGVRAVFRLNEKELAVLKSAGFTLEIGALLNIGEGTFPTLEDASHRVVFLSGGERNDAFFLDDTQAAFGVNYYMPTQGMSIDSLHIAAYMKLTDEKGEEVVIYVPAGEKTDGTSLFYAYRAALSFPEYEENAFLQETYDQCFEYLALSVDPQTGSDENDGVKAPVKTLGKALSLALSLLENETPIDLTLHLLSGEHRIGTHLILDSKDIHNPYYRLHFLGEEGDASILTGAVPLENSGFQQVEGEAYYAYQMERNADGSYPDFRFFFADGKVQEVAHHGYNRTEEAEQAGGIHLMWKVPYEFAGVQAGGGDQPIEGLYRLYVPKAAVEGLDNSAFASGKVEMHTPIAWYYQVMHLDSVDFSDEVDGNVAVYVRPEEAKRANCRHGFKGQYFWLQNSLAFLDEPGEFFYDNEKGILYYYPAEDVDMAQADFEIPVSDHLLSLNGVSNISFRNLVFTGNDNTVFDKDIYKGGQATTAVGAFGTNSLAALHLTDAKNVTVENCLFHDLATTGLRFAGVTENVAVLSCRFERIGSSAMIFGKHDGAWDDLTNANRNIEVYNNYLHDIAWYTRGSVGIYTGVADGMEIHQNTILNTSYSAISIGWRWGSVDWQYGTDTHLHHVDIHHNYFAGFMSDQQDGGAVYTLGGNVTPEYHEHFNSLHDNFAYFNQTTWDGKGIVMPYYHDGSSSNWHTYFNVVLLTPGRTVFVPIYLQNIVTERVHNVLVEDNDIIGNLKPKEMYKAGEEWDPLDLEYTIFGSDANCRRPEGDKSGYMYYSRVSRERFNEQKNNNLRDNPITLVKEESYVLDVINDAGSSFCKPDAEEILSAIQPLYDAWWAE